MSQFASSTTTLRADVVSVLLLIPLQHHAMIAASCNDCCDLTALVINCNDWTGHAQILAGILAGSGKESFPESLPAFDMKCTCCFNLTCFLIWHKCFESETWLRCSKAIGQTMVKAIKTNGHVVVTCCKWVEFVIIDLRCVLSVSSAWCHLCEAACVCFNLVFVL